MGLFPQACRGTRWPSCTTRPPTVMEVVRGAIVSSLGQQHLRQFLEARLRCHFGRDFSYYGTSCSYSSAAPHEKDHHIVITMGQPAWNNPGPQKLPVGRIQRSRCTHAWGAWWTRLERWWPGVWGKRVACLT